MSGYRSHRPPQEAPANHADAVIDGGDAATDYRVVFDNGSATVPAETSVALDFGGAT